jgi:hypothetical protein
MPSSSESRTKCCALQDGHLADPDPEKVNAFLTGFRPLALVCRFPTAESLRRYGQRARLRMAAQNKCAEIHLRAERKLGHLAGTPRNSGGRPLFRCGTGFLPSTISASPETLAPGRSDWRRSRPRISIDICRRRRAGTGDHYAAVAVLFQGATGDSEEPTSDRRGPHRRSDRRFSAATKHFPAVTLSRRWLPTWIARLAVRGGPRCRAVPCVSRTLRQSEQGESIAEGQILRGIEIAY